MKDNNLGDLYHLPPKTNEKIGGIKMPPNSDLWGEAVFNTFSEQYGDLAEMSGGSVEWDQSLMDEENGYGVGSIIINSNEKVIRIPIIVKEFLLKPIDIFEFDGKMKLINSENIGAALKEQDSIGEVSYKDKSRFPTERYLTWASKTSDEKSWTKKVKSFTKIAKSIGGPYVDRPLQILTDYSPQKEEKLATCYFVEMKSMNKFAISGFQSGQITKLAEGDSLLVEKEIGQDVKLVIKQAINSGSSIYVKQGEEIADSQIGIVGIGDASGFKTIEVPGVYECIKITEDGVDPVAVFAMNMHPLGSKSETPAGNLFVVNNGKEGLDYSIQEESIGKPLKSDDFSFEDVVVPIKDLKRYEQGCILLPGKDSVENCSDVLRVDRIESTPRGQIRVFFKGNYGDIHYLIDDDFKKIFDLFETNPAYSQNAAINVIGPNLLFLKLNKVVEMVSSLDQHQTFYDRSLSKAAGGEQLIVRYLDDTQKVMSKFGKQSFEDSAERFMARMVSLGVSPNKTASIIAHLRETKNPITIIGINPQIKEVPVYDNVKLAKLLQFVRDIKIDLIKSAAVIEGESANREVAMSVMGLGMADEENIRYFVQLIPTLEDLTSVLAKMLYSVRVGDIKIDESAIKSALINVTKIIGKLRELSSGI